MRPRVFLATATAWTVFLIIAITAAAQELQKGPTPASSVSAPPGPVYTVTVPILMYHHIGEPKGGRYNIAQGNFEWQMDYLGQHGFTVVSIDQVAAALIIGLTLPPKPIAITFDDGWRYQFTNTVPALLRNHLRATYYIIYSHAERYPGYMNFDQLRQLRDKGMWIGSHTVSHPNLRVLPELRLSWELSASKQALQAILGQPVTTLAYPYGAFNMRVEQATREAGYIAAVSVYGGAVQRSDQLYELRRIAIQGFISQQFFISLVERPFAPTQPH